MKTGDQVIYLKELKGLIPKTIGILTVLNGEKGSIHYPQNYFKLVNDSWIWVQTDKNKISSHSCLLVDIRLI